MTTLFFIIGLVVLFVVGVVSPHVAGKIQRKADKEAGWLKRLANWLWDPVTWWVKLSIDSSRKAIKKAAGWGKKTHRKM